MKKQFSFEAKRLYQRQEDKLHWKYYQSLLPPFFRRTMVIFLLCLLMAAAILLYHLFHLRTLAGTPINADAVSLYLRFWDFNSAIYALDSAMRAYDPNLPDKVFRKDYVLIFDWFTAGKSTVYLREFKFTAIAGIFGAAAVAAYWTRLQIQADRLADEQENFIRGARLLTPTELAKRCATDKAVLRIGQIPISLDIETKHVLTFGASGSGKSVLLSQFINQICTDRRQNKSRRHFILTDVKPEFVGKFYEDGDIIFCPFDKRSVNWNIFDEIKDNFDFDNFAAALFPPDNTKEPFWANSAASIFSDCLKALYSYGATDTTSLLALFQQGSVGIRDFLAKVLPSQEFSSLLHFQGAETTLGGILSQLNEGLRPFRVLADTDGPSFSFRKYIREELRRPDGTIPNLYIIIPSNRADLMAPLVTLIVNLMIDETLSLPEDKHRRVHFILDELGALNKIPKLPDLITKGRSYGASIIAMSQDSGLIAHKYGKEVLDSFLNNFATQIYLRVNESTTAKKLSESLGEREFFEYSFTTQRDDTGKDNTTYTKTQKTEPLVMPSELQALPTFCGFVKIADLGVTKCRVPKQFFKDRLPNFVERPLPLIKQLETVPEDDPPAEPATVPAVETPTKPAKQTSQQVTPATDTSVPGSRQTAPDTGNTVTGDKHVHHLSRQEL